MPAKKAGAPLSNTALIGRAREVRRLLAAYVDLHRLWLQAEFPDWRERSAKILERASDQLASLRADDARTGQLGARLAVTPFERARCLEVPGELAISAWRRGAAAETAADLAEALRLGDGQLARSLFRELAERMTRMGPG
jgi:hypothetical protein